MSGKEVSAKVTVLCLHCQAVLSGRDKVEDRIAVMKKEGVVPSSLLAQCWELAPPYGGYVATFSSRCSRLPTSIGRASSFSKSMMFSVVLSCRDVSQMRERSSFMK